jgi:hypothetical protein
VATLVNRSTSSGSFETSWDGLDDRGREAASGIYFVRVEADGAVRGSKVLLMR